MSDEQPTGALHWFKHRLGLFKRQFGGGVGENRKGANLDAFASVPHDSLISDTPSAPGAPPGYVPSQQERGPRH